MKKARLTSEEEDLSAKDDHDDDHEDYADNDHEDNDTATVQTMHQRRPKSSNRSCQKDRHESGNSCSSIAAATATCTNKSLTSLVEGEQADVQAARAEDRVKHEMEMEVEVELEEERSLVVLSLSPLPPTNFEEGEGQLLSPPPDQLVYDFASSSDYLLPFEDLKFYMDPEERLLPPEQQQQLGQLLLPDRGSGSFNMLQAINVGGPQQQMVAPPSVTEASRISSWSPPSEVALPQLPRYEDIAMLPSFKDSSLSDHSESGLVELQPPAVAVQLPAATSCPSCHCDLSCTATAAVSLSVATSTTAGPSASCDSFLSFPEHSLDIEKYL